MSKWLDRLQEIGEEIADAATTTPREKRRRKNHQALLDEREAERQRLAAIAEQKALERQEAEAKVTRERFRQLGRKGRENIIQFPGVTHDEPEATESEGTTVIETVQPEPEATGQRRGRRSSRRSGKRSHSRSGGEQQASPTLSKREQRNRARAERRRNLSTAKKEAKTATIGAITAEYQLKLEEALSKTAPELAAYIVDNLAFFQKKDPKSSKDLREFKKGFTGRGRISLRGNVIAIIVEYKAKVKEATTPKKKTVKKEKKTEKPPARRTRTRHTRRAKTEGEGEGKKEGGEEKK